VPNGTAMRTVLLLTISNIFMTFAWYGHLKWFPKGKQAAVWAVVLLSWGIAFFEYCFQVPANRIGEHVEGFTLGQLKVTQEIITLAVFAVFSISFMNQKLTWNYYVAFTLMVAAAFFIFMNRTAP
jgi:uncharacterized protein